MSHTYNAQDFEKVAAIRSHYFNARGELYSAQKLKEPLKLMDDFGLTPAQRQLIGAIFASVETEGIEKAAVFSSRATGRHILF